MQLLSPEVIEKKILENFFEYHNLFVEFESNFLSEMYNRYQGVENGNLVLYFAKSTHQEILRQKDYNLNFDLSFEKFWENHSLINLEKKSIIKIASDTSLPKETTRRKISLLIKQKVLNKKNKNIEWSPNEQYKKNYNLFIQKEIRDISKLINFICKKININISNKEITEELKKKFSFYWFHYLDAQLKYLKLWSQQLNDLEILLIGMQFICLFSSEAKKKNLFHQNIYKDTSLIKNYISASVSATSIAEVTGISRATCIRKLVALVEMKVVSQDKISKRYYLAQDILSNNLASKKINEEAIKLFSEFYFICLRAINTKNSN
tara:strand:- start:1044 stop:2009 length:966 start_codon:yes stop_codon:yes gene_type:complete